MKNIKLIMMVLLLNTFFVSSVFAVPPVSAIQKKAKKAKKNLSSPERREIRQRTVNDRVIRALKSEKLQKRLGARRLKKALGGNRFKSAEIHNRLAEIFKANRLVLKLYRDLKSENALYLWQESLDNRPQIEE